MLNSAWPELYWQLYDTYLQPNGAFYGVKKACTPLHAIYRYGFDDIFIANENLLDANNITVKIKAYNINSQVIFADEWKGSIKTNISKSIYKLPKIENLTDVWFLDLRIFNEENEELDANFYWLSKKEDVLDYKAAEKMSFAFHTPSKEYADFTSLNKLPKINLLCDYDYSKTEKEGVITLTVKNTSNSIAFFVFFDVVDSKSKKPVLPIFWNDNYISLLPGEERAYKATYNLEDSKNGKPELKIKAWNVEDIILK
jgi:exo-1,4-beta-D-glucosaminidase